jgi:CRISPR/Cas system-associated exonuclease Cas4 (RecB family)
MSFPGKTNLKFVPSRARYYIKCPHFLYLSNNKEIYIPYSQIASQKGNFFEKIVLNKISENTGYEISRAKQVTDILKANGLYTLNKKVDTEFYSTRNVGFTVGMLKPDLILSTKANNGVEISVIEIKNSDDLKPHHCVQAYIYKLTLEKLLSESTGRPVHIRIMMAHWGKGFYPQDEYESGFELFRKRLTLMNHHAIICENYLDMQTEDSLNRILQEIASLQANTAECGSCPGAERCGHAHGNHISR